MRERVGLALEKVEARVEVSESDSSNIRSSKSQSRDPYPKSEDCRLCSQRGLRRLAINEDEVRRTSPAAPRSSSPNILHMGGCVWTGMLMSLSLTIRPTCGPGFPDAGRLERSVCMGFEGADCLRR